MASIDSPPKKLAPGLMDSISLSSYIAPTLAFSSGIVFTQYGKFCGQLSAHKSRLPFRLATGAILIHLAQLVMDFIPERFGTCAGGMWTGVEFRRLSITDGIDFIKKKGPKRLLAVYTIWLGCNSIADGIITAIMIRGLYLKQRSMRHKSLRTLLGRLVTVILNTFSLTFFIACLSLIALIPPMIHTVPASVQSACQAASYILNGMLPRIYLISFFCSFRLGYHCSSRPATSCVASLRSYSVDCNAPLMGSHHVGRQAVEHINGMIPTRTQSRFQLKKRKTEVKFDMLTGPRLSRDRTPDNNI